jgi:hypothetical protein
MARAGLALENFQRATVGFGVAGDEVDAETMMTSSAAMSHRIQRRWKLRGRTSGGVMRGHWTKSRAQIQCNFPALRFGAVQRGGATL